MYTTDSVKTNKSINKKSINILTDQPGSVNANIKLQIL